MRVILRLKRTLNIDAENVDLEEVHWAMVNEENTEYQMYESGELDTAAIPSDLAEQLLDNEDAFFVDQAGTYFYRFNVEMEPFQNEKIRKAFAKVINQEDIVQYITKNKEVPAKGFVSQDLPMLTVMTSVKRAATY